MVVVNSTSGSVLPHGRSDLLRQVTIWLGFAVAYQIVRGIVDQRPPSLAFSHGFRVVHFERQLTHRLYELTLQHFVDHQRVLETLVSWTYWNSEFTVVGITVLWVYLRRNDAFYRFRNSILLANILGLVGYAVWPTAPPRMLGLGFADSHRDGFLQLVANPYAAMPSLHAADALIVGIVVFSLCRSHWARLFWAVWPAWVWFAVMATGNHFWLDCVAGIAVALVSMAAAYSSPSRALRAARRV